MNNIDIIREFVELINKKDILHMRDYIDETSHFHSFSSLAQSNIKLPNLLETLVHHIGLAENFNIEILHIAQNVQDVLMTGILTVGATIDSIPSSQITRAAWRIEVSAQGKISAWEEYVDTSSLLTILLAKNKRRSMAGQEVTGLGGFFIKSENPSRLTAWYDHYLGTQFGKESNHSFKWCERNPPHQIGRTEFSIFPSSSDYYAPSAKPFMLNLRVKNLDQILDFLRSKDVQIVGTPESHSYGKFGWILDCDGNKIELWEPIDEELEKWDAENGR